MSREHKRGKSWLLGWLTQWTQHNTAPSPEPSSTPPTPSSCRQEDDNGHWLTATTSTTTTCGTSHCQLEDDGYATRRSSLSTTTASHDKSDPASGHIRKSTMHLYPANPPPTPPPQPTPHRRSLMFGRKTPASERRSSQQTGSSSLFSREQHSAASFRRRSCGERSILRDLWSKARHHHPHYPAFHWPLGRHQNHRQHHHSRHFSLSRSDQDQHDLDGAHTVGGTPRPSCDDPVSPHSAHSFQEPHPHHHDLPYHQHHHQHHHHPHHHRHQHYPLSLHRHSQPENKRHSIASQISGDYSLASRPASIFYSQPTSPNFTALLKDGLLYKDQTDDDIDPYWLEDDEPRPERWVVKPELVQLVIEDGLFCSPFNISPSAGSTEKYILQVGCGDGAWGAAVARQYPKWVVIGMDDGKGPTPNRRMVPRNFRFIRCQESLLEGLKLLPDNAVDLVHCRFLALIYPADQYQELVQECWRVCKPDGYIELIELDMRIYAGRKIPAPVTQMFNSEVIHAMESKSLDPRLARCLKQMLANLSQEEGCHALHQANYISLPLGLWGGRIGVMFRDDIRSLFELFQTSVAECNQAPVRTDQDLEAACDTMDEEMEQQHSFMNLHYAYAQKVQRASA